MPKSFHCRVLKPFDNYDHAGSIAVLSEGGFARMTTSKKFADHIELLASEENGDIFDPKGVKVATRKSGGVDVVALHQAFVRGESKAIDASPRDREEKTAKTR